MNREGSCRPHQAVNIDHKRLNQIENRHRDSARVDDKSAGAVLALMAVWHGLLIAISGLLLRGGRGRMMVMMRTAVCHRTSRFPVSTASSMSVSCGISTGGNLRLVVTRTRVGVVPATTEDAVDQHHGEHQSLCNPQHGNAFRKTIDPRDYTPTVYHTGIIDSRGHLDHPNSGGVSCDWLCSSHIWSRFRPDCLTCETLTIFPILTVMAGEPRRNQSPSGFPSGARLRGDMTHAFVRYP